jgi:hypothetical protein
MGWGSAAKKRVEKSQITNGLAQVLTAGGRAPAPLTLKMHAAQGGTTWGTRQRSTAGHAAQDTPND